MGVRLLRSSSRTLAKVGRGLCRCEVAAWVEGEARGGLNELKKRRARGGRARLALARSR
jgi:hypothetical protein